MHRLSATAGESIGPHHAQLWLSTASNVDEITGNLPAVSAQLHGARVPAGRHQRNAGTLRSEVRFRMHVKPRRAKLSSEITSRHARD
jgi:hypothetical protein